MIAIMDLTFRQLKNLPVYTKSNEYLGKIQEMEINSETQNISKYIIKSSQVSKRLVGKKLWLNPHQVISIDEQKMIVEDGAVKEGVLVNEPAGV